MMDCPKCREPLEVHLNEYRELEAPWEELNFRCPNGHEYFARVHQEDLMEEIE